MLRDHGYGASALQSVPVYTPAFAGIKLYCLVPEAHGCEQLPKVVTWQQGGLRLIQQLLSHQPDALATRLSSKTPKAFVKRTSLLGDLLDSKDLTAAKPGSKLGLNEAQMELKTVNETDNDDFPSSQRQVCTEQQMTNLMFLLFTIHFIPLQQTFHKTQTTTTTTTFV